MTLKYAIAALLLASVFPGPSYAEDWALYRDSVHDCRLEYSSSRFSQDKWDSAKEYQRFSGSDAQTFFRVKGVDNEENLSPDDVKARYLEEDVPGDVVYESKKTDFLVLSGFRGDSIFYTKVALSADKQTLCILEITYPRQAKQAFDADVTRMSRSFAAGK